MLDLVYKDLVAARWFLLAALPIYALQLATLGESPPATMAVALIFSAAFAFGSVIIEETQATEITWCSLPVGRDRIVVARYLTTLLGLLIGLGLAAAIRGGELSAGPLALAFFNLQIAAAIFYPCYFRLGAGRGMVAFALVMLGLTVALAAIQALLAAATGTTFVPDPARMEALGERLAALEPLLATGLVAVALAVTAGSVALAVRWYGRREC